MKKTNLFDRNHFEDLLWSQRFSAAASQILLAMMVACLVAPVASIGQRVFPTWQFSYLIPLAFLISLESIFSSRKLKNVPFVETEWWLYHVAEWVVILLVVKAAQYTTIGWQPTMSDISTWRVDFFKNFFTTEFLIVSGIIVLVWIISGELAGLLRQLETDEILLTTQLDSEYYEQRSAIRQRLAGLIIAYGALQVILTTLVRLNSGELWGDTPAVQGGVLAVLLYFILGLALLGLTQFSVLRVRWMLDRVKIERSLARRWLMYVIWLLFVMAIIAVLLPTGFSQDFLRALQVGFAYFLNLLITLILLILTPFLLLYSWLMSLLRPSNPVNIKIEPFKLTPLPRLQPSPPIPWVEQVLDILLWAMVIGLVVFSIYYYVREHAELLEWLQKNRFVNGIFSLWRSLAAWFKRTEKKARLAISSSLEKVRRSSSVPIQAVSTRLRNPRRMPPRQQVFFYYLAMVQRAGQTVLPRAAAQTPVEYAQVLKARLEESHQMVKDDDDLPVAKTEKEFQDISDLTERFVEARYSRHEITSGQAALARIYWEQIYRRLRRR